MDTEHIRQAAVNYYFSTQNEVSMQYTVLSDLEHLKKRKEVYLGTVSNVSKEIYVYDKDSQSLTYKTVTYNTGLLKLFDEIFANAVDNYQRTIECKSSHKTTSIDVMLYDDHISVCNNGDSIEVKKQKISTGEELYVPEMIFTKLRSGSNFDDEGTKRTWGGMNGMGSKIVTFLSSCFEIELLCDKTFYKQTIEDSTNKINKPVIKKITSVAQLNKLTSDEHKSMADFTKITYYPIFSEFEGAPDHFDDDFISVATSRVYDVCYLPLTLSINGYTLPKLSWAEFVTKHAEAISEKGKNRVPICVDPIITFKSDKNWLVSVSTLNQELKCKVSPTSYVNYICTQDGGTHVNYIVSQLSNAIKSKSNASIKDKLFICMSTIVENPKFTSQAKDALSTTQKELTNLCVLPKKFLNDFVKNTPIIDILEGKAIAKSNRETRNKNIASIPKAKDAVYAGTSKRAETRLILTEGDSALTTAVRGVEHIKGGINYFGMFPLRGKSLNVRQNPRDKYLQNEELNNIKVLLGLEDGKTYTDVKQLRYGGVILMTDADTDGAHIKSLIINFFDVKFPSLLKIDGFIREFITPMIKVTMKPSSQLWKTHSAALKDKAYKGVGDTRIYPLYNRIEFAKFENEFLNNVAKAGYEIDYIKGLATIEKSDTEHYFDNFEDSEIRFTFEDPSRQLIDLAFCKNRGDDRKKWIESITEDTHLERVPRKPISCSDFMNTDWCLFSLDNCIRSIPSAIDGLKPTQRKILCAMLNMGKKAFNKIKVTELGGLVTKEMKYEHGDMAMNETIIGMAQDFTGSNNCNILMPIGEFGTRRQNGDDHGSPRYVHTSLNPIIRKIFPEEDDVVYDYRYEEGEKVEPMYYIPIIPMVLINGAKGIATGWSTEIPAFDPKELVRLVNELVNNKRKDITALDLPAHYNGYGGNIVYEISSKYSSVKSRNPKVKVELVTDTKAKLPRWSYRGKYSFTKNDKILKLTVEDANPTVSVESIYETINKMLIEDPPRALKFNPTKFSIPQFTAEFDAEKITEEELIKILDLDGAITATNMVLFDSEGKIQKYPEISKIVEEWFEARYGCYEKRIGYIIEQITKELMAISNRYRFVKEIAIDKTLNVNNKRKSVLEDELTTKKYDKIDDSYNYLLSMPIHSLTKERLDELRKQLDETTERLNYYKAVSVEELWTSELEAL